MEIIPCVVKKGKNVSRDCKYALWEIILLKYKGIYFIFIYYINFYNIFIYAMCSVTSISKIYDKINLILYSV